MKGKHCTEWLLYTILGVVALILLVKVAFIDGGLDIGLGGQVSQLGDTPSIGKLLFTAYLLPFEIASVLLLVAIIGAVILAKQNLKPSQ